MTFLEWIACIAGVVAMLLLTLSMRNVGGWVTRPRQLVASRRYRQDIAMVPTDLIARACRAREGVRSGVRHG